MEKDMGMIEEALRDRGFVQTLGDEPHEDYWMLEHNGAATDLLVESETSGWSLARSPSGEEPKGEWIEVASGLSADGVLAAVDAMMAVKA